uniref:Uncharacterized protein n=1 Tax=Branchiostoma floridae TaxID=7739 RepID=C3Y7E2_BRAFL|eukprot:XP_002607760.1 hypothetical protein BRAFLDRAFT_82791 [Branchiostoma floridae]
MAEVGQILIGKATTIVFDGNSTPSPYEPQSILNQYLECYLVQKYLKNGDPGTKVFRTQNKNVPPENVKVRVYSYTSIPPADGTYVVLQFEKSTMYFTFDEDEPEYTSLQLPKDFKPEYPKNAEDINTTADPRVFLMKTHVGMTELIFASCVGSQQQPGDKSKAQVITLTEFKKKQLNRALFKLQADENNQSVIMGNRSSKKTVEPAPQRQTLVAGNKNSRGDVQVESAAIATIQLKFSEANPMVIMNNTTSSTGFLQPKRVTINDKKRWRASRFENLTPGNKYEAILLVYSYQKLQVGEPTGTYVVLQFLQSERYIFALPNAPKQLALIQGDDILNFEENAEDITAINDPRMFLMSSDGSDFIFTSCYEKSKGNVITFVEDEDNNQIAVLMPEGDWPKESQQFQPVHFAGFTKERTSADRLEVVPFPEPTPSMDK